MGDGVKSGSWGAPAKWQGSPLQKVGSGGCGGSGGLAACQNQSSRALRGHAEWHVLRPLSLLTICLGIQPPIAWSHYSWLLPVSLPSKPQTALVTT